jgi:hypothetical protein
LYLYCCLLDLLLIAFAAAAGGVLVCYLAADLYVI